MAQEDLNKYKWAMTVDIDRCTGCQACVVACQAENNVPINDADSFEKHRAIEWIHIERYWEGEFPDIKARFIPIFCQHCENAPCEPVCPVYATYHNNEGLNVQVYNRCIGTRYCANNCPYQVRFFNFWEPDWPDSLKEQLNPDVTVRSRGIMEKCSFCIQRIRKAEIKFKGEGMDVPDGAINPACVQACPTDTLIFGNIKDDTSKVSKKAKDRRGYHLLEELGTDPNVIYLKKVESGEHVEAHEH
jgi:molybdopterin-containing oxidoreductase family iron-sulfur binding subunit